jgi:hypothetical protein
LTPIRFGKSIEPVRYAVQDIRFACAMIFVKNSIMGDFDSRRVLDEDFASLEFCTTKLMLLWCLFRFWGSASLQGRPPIANPSGEDRGEMGVSSLETADHPQVRGKQKNTTYLDN